MNSAKPILTSLFLILTFFLSAQTYTKLIDGSTIPPGKPYYILPKGSFIIEIPVVKSELIKGPKFAKYDETILLMAKEKIGLDIKKYSSLKPDSIKNIPTYAISEDSLKISMKAVPDYDKIFYLSSERKWNKSQSITFNYVDGGILTETEASREDKTTDIVSKGLSALSSIVGAFFTGQIPKFGESDPRQISADSLFILKMESILNKIKNPVYRDNFEVYKDIRAQYEKEFNSLFSQYFYSEKKVVMTYKFHYIPSDTTKQNDLIPFFSFDKNKGEVYFSEDIENLIWGKIVTSKGFDGNTSYKIRFKRSGDQLMEKFSGFTPKSIGLAYNVPKKVEFHLIKPDSNIIFNEIFKIPQFGKIGFIESIKDGKISETLDPTTGELLKLSVSSNSITGEQIDAASSTAKDLINSIKGDDATTKLEKEVKILELEKKKQDLLKALGQQE